MIISYKHWRIVYYPCLPHFIILDRKKPEYFIYFPIVTLVRLMGCLREIGKRLQNEKVFKNKGVIHM